jgi:hypothetical protein
VDLIVYAGAGAGVSVIAPPSLTGTPAPTPVRSGYARAKR